ncbi:SulP family inorganic anion transporter [Streptomyces sp. NPDC048606]|uniref:SulP family inorganic anion transporter n=1 Tax=Streptomyces sp. NPDC048606 TaxID=3154726 RepID=UPI003420B9C1
MNNRTPTAGPPGPTDAGALSSALAALRTPTLLRKEAAASLVVFLVALPLCVGVAVASGVPAELGIVTGIVGGILVGLMPGSRIQVSGPAAGLTVLVFEAVREFGLGMLGAIVLATGLLQVLLGLARCGRWFRAISVSVVQGMLAGIGLVLVFGQLYTLAGAAQPRSGTDKILGVPRLVVDTVTSGPALTAAGVGLLAGVVLVAWKWTPARVRAVPAPLAAVVLATALVAGLGLDVPRVEVRGLLEAVQLPSLGALQGLGTLAVLGTVLAFTLIASAESLFSAAAVDRMHDGPRTHYDKELVAQGVGNTVCGVLGALPMTAVIVRSAANVQAGATTLLSRVMHGVWLLLFTVLWPAAIGVIPLPALAAVLVHAGCKLIPFKALVPLWRRHRGEALILCATAIAIVTTSMFEGVVVGLLLAVVKAAWETSHVQLTTRELVGGRTVVELTGNATFLRLPHILETLEALPKDRPVELDLTEVRHLDHACRAALEGWAARHHDAGTTPVKLREAEPSATAPATGSGSRPAAD